LQRGSAESRPVAEAHLSYEQLEAFVDEKGSPAETQRVRAHVAACRLCAEELRDLRTFKAELIHTHPVVAQTQKVWWAAHVASLLRARPVFVAVASAALILMAVMGLNTLQSRRSTKTPQVVGPLASSQISSRDAMFPALATDEKKEVLQSLDRLQTSVPDSLSRLQQKNQTLLGESANPSALEVLQPVGEVVRAERPLFRWRPISNATYYLIAVFDANLNQVESSDRLQDSQWTSTRALKRGQVYQWQVTAHLDDGSSVNAPAPPQPEAKFRVLDQQKEEDLSRFASAHAAAHLPLGILEGEMGLLSGAEREFQQIPKDDPDYQLAQSLLKRIEELRGPGKG
jgi:hypothetical protein